MALLHWSDLPRSRKAAVIGLAAFEQVLTILALRDLIRRPSEQVRGPKVLWFVVCFVQPVGPSAYLRFGRKR